MYATYATPPHAMPPMQIMLCMQSLPAILGSMAKIAGRVTIHDGLYTNIKMLFPQEMEVLGAHRTDPVAFRHLRSLLWLFHLAM